jgi:Fic-DOC domain mobile mystery protein B
MPDPLLPAGDGHTELSEEDRLGLIASYISTRGELFDAEQRSIATALVRRRVPTVIELLDDKYLRDLHRAMFREVWRWAGKQRRTETNIGIDPAQIGVALRSLTSDARMWVERATFQPDELVTRFHHRLVQIHPFPNGNGRLGRIAADYLAVGLGRPRFTWGAKLDVTTDELRARYRSALIKADAGDLADLLLFVRT